MTASASRRFTALCCAFFCVGLLLPGAGDAQPSFTDVTEEMGITLFPARTVAFGDYDNDGLPDFFLPEALIDFWPILNHRVELLHNEGNGRFARRTAALQADIPLDKWKGAGTVFGDYDNDGDLDLFVSIGGIRTIYASRNALLRNDRGVFRDVAQEAGLTEVASTDNAIWLDYDRDGHLDLYVANVGGYFPEESDSTMRNRLYRNNGDGTFADVTGETGLDIQFNEMDGGSNGGMAASDVNGDGWPDLYVGVFGERNRLFLNDTQGGFKDMTTSEIAEGDAISNAFGVGVGDINNDGNQDIFQAAGSWFGPFRSPMLLNTGEGEFLDVTEAIGLSPIMAKGEAQGGGLADLDNDGDLDLMIAKPQFLFVNQGDGTFVEGTSQSGIGDVGYAMSFADFDLDGFLDVYFPADASLVKPGRLYRNNGNGNHWLRVELVGVESNRSGIGARLVATSGSLQQTREVLGGLGRYQDELVAHFGLGERNRVDRLEIHWPSGQVDVVTDIPVDQKIRVFEGREVFHAVQPSVWEGVIPDSVTAGATADFSVQIRPALFAPDATVVNVTADLSDLGGPAAISLVDAGDGSYRMESLSFAVTAPAGSRVISFAIEQSTPMGLHWSEVSRTIQVLPAAWPSEDLVIFADELADGWQAEVARGHLDFAERAVVQQGEFSLALESELAFMLDMNRDEVDCRLIPAEPVDPMVYESLRFAFHHGQTIARTGPGNSSFNGILYVLVNDYTLTFSFREMESRPKDWLVFDIPLSSFGLTEPIESIRITCTLQGTSYLDDIRLVAAEPPASITAVTEDHASTLPQFFTLDQNYPNPFNSATVIRFALPTAADVELSIFNLAGQQVETLADGLREAGTYTVRWDGRDDSGRELASGVYLYRLRTGDGQQAETRKLLLLR